MADERRRASYRTDPKGGPVRDRAQLIPASALVRRHVVLLVHGYNNTEKAGREAYDAFFRLQHEINANPSAPVGGDCVIDVYWPGDEDWGVLGFASYMKSIPKALATADRLATELQEAARSGLAIVDIVGHSMGCRLALEVIELLRAQGSPILVDRVAFMAAAVPLHKLAQTPPGSLRAALDSMAPASLLNLYSRDDQVLSTAFPAGQSMAGGDEGSWPTALGHDLWPDPARPTSLVFERVTGAGHSDYWGWKAATLSHARHAARSVRAFLRFPEAAIAELASRMIEDRELVSRPEPDARLIESREVGG